MSIQTALVKRAENLELPLQGLRAVSELRAELDALQKAHVLAARDKGASWAEIAEALGISRQALQQKMKAANSRTLGPDRTISLEESPSTPSDAQESIDLPSNRDR